MSRFSLVALSVILSLLSTLSLGQLVAYESGPTRWYTFDVNTNRTGNDPSSFTWEFGRQPHVGRAQFNGVYNWIDLYRFPDDRGDVFPSTLPLSISFEFWVQYSQLNRWSRLFECGNGAFSDNIILSNIESTNDFRAAFYRGNVSVNQFSVASRSIFPNTWQHIVVSIAQKNLNDSTSASAAEINIYIDGVLVNKRDSAYLLRDVIRTECFLGKKGWESTDQYFSGWIDDFFFYNYPLSGEQAAVHHVLQRPPVYELTFSVDPRRMTDFRYAYTYSWSNVSPGDNSSVAKFHDGHLDLTGDQFIDLNAPQQWAPQSWTGADPPPMIGGFAKSGADGTLPVGWTIEVMFKAKTIELWAKVFDLARGPGLDNVLLGYEGGSTTLRLEVYNSLLGNYSSIRVVQSLNVGQWYHVVLVFTPYATNENLGTVYAYLDGKLVASGAFNMPRRIARTHSYIGKSNWNDQFMDMYLDAFRIYDYSLTGSDVSDLYGVTQEKIPEDLNPTITSNYHTWPVTGYTFNNQTNVRRQQGDEGTNFTYVAGQYPRIGIASFDGVSQYVNLQYYESETSFQVLPRIGGSLSLELWVRWDSLKAWAHVLDLGSAQPYNGNNILISNFGGSDTLVFDVYGGEYHNSLTVPNAIRVGVWHHIVTVVEQINKNDWTSASAARIRIYVDGTVRNEIIGYLPQPVARPNSFIGRSNWPGDAPFHGQIDALLYYDYGLTYEQVAAHFILPKPPAFELAFSRDPRPWIDANRISQFTYRWEEYGPGENSTSSSHAGHLLLDGNEYVNLTTYDGLSSIGTIMPPVIFGTSAAATWSGGVYNGWSIEFTVQILQHENGNKIFDCGVSAGIDEFGVGFDWTRNAMKLFVFRPGVPGMDMTFLEDVKFNTWYHIMIVGRRQSGNSPNGTYTAFVNGEEQVTRNNFPWPRAVARPQCYLGKSLWIGDGYMDMRLDTFRIYDFFVTAAQVEQLYLLTVNGLPNYVKPLYTTAPLLEYSFDTEPDIEQFNGGTAFTWQQGSGAHRGLAHFNGVDEFVNLLAFSDDTNTPFPMVIGNQSFSFEWWVQFDEFNQMSRLLDLGTGAMMDNILVANSQSSGYIVLHTYMRNDYSQLIAPIQLNLSQWHHIVVTLDDLTVYPAGWNIDPESNVAARQEMWVDGQLLSSALGYRPRAVERLFAYVGRSHWVADRYFKGSIDAFYMYDYALSGEQVNVRLRMPRPPIFDLSFSNDPRYRLGSFPAFYSYSWQQYDPKDSFSPGVEFHSGHIVLNETFGNFVNLSTPVGFNSVGVVLPRIGGRSPALTGTKEGWTFEFIVKVDTISRWAKLIDWGNGPGMDNIILGYESTSRNLEFRVCNSAKDPTGSYAMTVQENVSLGQWYHFLIVITPTSYENYEAIWEAYVDGSKQQIDRNGWLPQSIQRRSALIGKTNWPLNDDGLFSAKVDAIRVYDYAIGETQAQVLYELAHDPSAIPVPRASSSSTGANILPSSSARAASSSARVSSSSTAASRIPCHWPWEGPYWPYCECVDPEDPECAPEECDPYYEDCPEYSSSGSQPGLIGGLTTAAVIGIVFAVIVGIAAIGYLYIKYCRDSTGRSSDSDDKQSLLGDTSMGVERDNQYSQWVPPPISGSAAVTTASAAQPTQASSETSASHF